MAKCHMPFIPDRDAEFAAMATFFASGIASAPSAYGVSAGDSQAISAAVDEFIAALNIARSPLTRTPSSVNDKDTKRNAAKGLIRMYANQFRANMGINDQALIEIGIRRRPTTLQRRRCPQSSPRLGFVATTPGVDVLTFADSLTPHARAKPFGAERLELFVAYLNERPKGSQVPPKDVRYVGWFRKNPINVPHDAEESAAGLRPTYWARWAGHNSGDFGPWSLPCSLAIATEQAAKKASETIEAKPECEADQPMQQAA